MSDSANLLSVEDGNFVILGDALEVARRIPDQTAQLVYLDPPFNTGQTQRRVSLSTFSAPDGDRTGFGGRRYRSEIRSHHEYKDSYDDYLAFLRPILVEVRRILTHDGTLYFHIDPRESHYCKVLLDEIFGREAFLNEIIWAYDFGGRSTRRWPQKHDTILVFVRTPGHHHFSQDEVARIPYMAPGLVTPEKRARGKFPTDVWWHTIVPTSGKEKTGYPTQKPLGILRRIVTASSEQGALVVDLFAGSGTTAVAAQEYGRRFLMVDQNPSATDIMRQRLASVHVTSLDLRSQD
ncbi:MAG: DNA-methyltransferase [Acidimicrobiales bacterium]